MGKEVPLWNLPFLTLPFAVSFLPITLLTLFSVSFLSLVLCPFPVPGVLRILSSNSAIAEVLRQPDNEILRKSRMLSLALVVILISYNNLHVKITIINKVFTMKYGLGGLALSPPKMSLSPTMKHTESGGELCEIFKF